MFRFILKHKEVRNKVIVFNEDQSRKIRKVLRMKRGDQVEVFDNQGWVYIVELEKITNEFSLGRIKSQELFERETNITLFQALPKNLKVKFIIQKCTELGVDRIVFFQSDFSQVKANLISKEKLARWRRIAEESTEQCGRVFVPEIVLETRSLTEIFSNLAHNNNYILDINGEKISKVVRINNQAINFFVGCEGGFSPKEVESAERFGIKKVKVSENILRSETASLTFLSQLYLLQN